MIYTKPFLDLQLEFAERLSTISGLPVAQTLLDYTNLYIRFGLGREFRPDHPVWQEYLDGMQRGEERAEYTYQFYLDQVEGISKPEEQECFGCFSFGMLEDGTLRLHFRNRVGGEGSPLSSRYQEERRSELKELFDYVGHSSLKPTEVKGVSWLYNLEAYRRLFPPSYIERGRIVRGRFRFMPLWGQFLDWRGDLKENIVEEFRKRLAEQRGMEGLDECFPFQVIEVEGSVDEFYRFYEDV